MVLTADRRANLGLLDLVRLAPEQRPPDIIRYASVLDHLLEVEGKVSAQAFVLDRLLSVGGQLVPITDPIYPRHLFHRLAPDPSPTVLTEVGNSDGSKTPLFGISGSRQSGTPGLAVPRA